MDGKIPLRSGKPFMLRQAQHERLAGRFLEVIFNGILSDENEFKFLFILSIKESFSYIDRFWSLPATEHALTTGRRLAQSPMIWFASKFRCRVRIAYLGGRSIAEASKGTQCVPYLASI